MLLSTIIFLFFLFLTYALFLMASRKSDARQARLQQRVSEALQEAPNRSIEEAIQITRQDSISRNPTLHRLLSPLNVINRLDRTLRQADMQITVSRLLGFCFLAALMAAFAAYTVFNLPSAVVVGVIAGVLPLLHVSRQRKKRLNLFNAQLPDTLELAVGLVMSADRAGFAPAHQADGAAGEDPAIALEVGIPRLVVDLVGHDLADIDGG